MASLAMRAVQQWSSGKIWAAIFVLTHSFCKLEKKSKQCWEQSLLVLTKLFKVIRATTNRRISEET